MKVIGVSLLILLAVGILHAVNAPPGPASRWANGVNQAVAESMAEKRDQCAAAFARLQAIGAVRNVRRGAGALHVAYDERIWRGLTYDEKMRQGLVMYCAEMPADGDLTVVIRGLYDNAKLGAVVSGHWID